MNTNIFAVANEIFTVFEEAEADGTIAKLETLVQSAESDLKDSPSLKNLLVALKKIKL